ncbi:cytochrome P450 7B1 [Latimeria chalumnae]|uniref:cytochrome P450 7B1 n=1 Tax=Latimeria chalumnae TaxID=7897 RepID=UPI00313D60BE
MQASSTFLLLVLIVLFLSVWWRRRRKAGEPPLEQGWIPLIGKTYGFIQDPLKFLRARQEKYGDIFTVYIAGRYITFVMDPFLYINVIRYRKQIDFQQFADDIASKTFGYPAINEDKFPSLNERIHKSYKYLQGETLENLTETLRNNLQWIFKRELPEVRDWRNEEMYHFCCRLMFEANFLTLYGKNCAIGGHKQMTEIRSMFEKFDKMFPYLVARIPIQLLGSTRSIREKLINYFLPKNMAVWKESSEIVQARKQLLEQYEVLMEKDKAAHHFAFLWASVGNTLPATFWALYYLVMHPEALAAVHDEIDHVLRSTGQEIDPDYIIHLTREKLDGLIYLGSAINESFRLCSASMNIRVAQEDFTLKFEETKAISLRKGDWVAFYPQSLHLDPEVYENPEVYKFDRFVEDGKEKTAFYKNGKKLRDYLMPFGSGVSKCPGRFFAVNEIKQFLILLIKYYDMEILPGERQVGLDSSRAGLGILLPNSPVHFRYKLRT